MFNRGVLVIAGDQAGILERHTVNQPWIECIFSETPVFASYRAVFEQESRALEDDDDEWEQLSNRISDFGVVIYADSGEIIYDPLIHIQGNEARFRY